MHGNEVMMTHKYFHHAEGMIYVYEYIQHALNEVMHTISEPKNTPHHRSELPRVW